MAAYSLISFVALVIIIWLCPQRKKEEKEQDASIWNAEKGSFTLLLGCKFIHNQLATCLQLQFCAARPHIWVIKLFMCRHRGKPMEDFHFTSRWSCWAGGNCSNKGTAPCAGGMVNCTQISWLQFTGLVLFCSHYCTAQWCNQAA